MRVYRERRPLEWPPDIVARRLFENGERREHTETRCRGLFRTTVRIDETDGAVVTTVRTPGVGILAAVATVLAAVAVFAPPIRIPVLWLCALAVAGPMAHLLPPLDARPSVGRVRSRRLTAASVPAFVGIISLLWVGIRPTLGSVATVLCVALLAIGAGCYVVATGWRTASVSSLWLAVAGLLPAVASVSNLAVAAALFGDSQSMGALVASVAFAAFSFLLVVTYCLLVYDAVAEASFEPLASERFRAVAFLGYLLVVATLCLTAFRLAGRVLDTAPWPVVAAALTPLALPVGGWLVDTAGTALARSRTLRRGNRRRIEGVTVLVLDVPGTHVRAVPFPQCVVVTRGVIETLSSEELTAVIAHERHHLRARNRLVATLATLAAAPVGRNALTAFLDYPARERAADRHAADTAGPEPLVRALRRLDETTGRPHRSPHLLVAPYALFYGAVSDAATYQPLEDRIAAVTRRPNRRR
jgi:Zn-dependent protease with chaperone function